MRLQRERRATRQFRQGQRAGQRPGAMHDGSPEPEQARQQRMLVDRVQVTGNRRVPAPRGFGHVKDFVTHWHCCAPIIRGAGRGRWSRHQRLAGRQRPRLAAPDTFTLAPRLGHQAETHAALFPARIRAAGPQIKRGMRRHGPGLDHALRQVHQPQRAKRELRVAEDGHVQGRRRQLQRQRRQTSSIGQPDAAAIGRKPGRIQRGTRQRAFDARQQGRIIQAPARVPEKPQRGGQQRQKGGRPQDRHDDANRA
ncbi:MAG: hypothetical protein IPI16_12305 [Comamonadaceae bacterium]|nr:hypothetical protein [Comamonadaceae bacterium]